MDSLIFFFFSLPISLFLSLLIIKLFFSSPSSASSKNNSKLPLPPGPPSLPIIGHLHLFKKPLHRTLARLSSLHGPALLLRFGSRPVFVISSLPLAEECFTKNDVAFASRPQLPSAKYFTYNYSTLASAPYGSYWRNVRRITTIELLSTARLQSLSDIRHDEGKSLVKSLFKEFESGCHSELKRVELKPSLFGLAFNVMMRMIAGKRSGGSEEARKFRVVVEEALAMIGVSNLSDFLPVLRLVDFGGVKRRMKRVTTEMDAMMQSLIDEQRRKRSEERCDDDKNKKKGLLDVLLDLQEEAPAYYSDDSIKAMIVTLFFAGTDTTTDTVEWAMTLLLNHQETLQKARTEIDSLVGNGRLFQEHDLPNAPYIQAIISETLRLCPATPLLVPHESLQDCVVGGYNIPRGMMLLVNAWGMNRDPNVWAEPMEFRPERFCGGGCGGGKTIPFGMGRRRCPGDGLATRVVGLVLGRLIHCFEWERIGREFIDMEETGGLTLHKANSLQVMYRPREVMVELLSSI